MAKKEKETLLDVLAVYKEMPVLWDRNNPNYKSKALRNQAYEELLAVFRKYDPDATLYNLKKKLENMRTIYQKEVKKVNMSKQSGVALEDVYKPTLWYFEALSFLDLTDETCNSETFNVAMKREDPLYSDEEESDAGFSYASAAPANKRQKAAIQRHEYLLNDTAEEHNTSYGAMNNEECEVTGKYIGVQLRDLNKRELAIAQKLISDVLFYAKIGRLTEDSHIVLGPT